MATGRSKKLTQREVKAVADQLDCVPAEECDQLSTRILEDIANSKQVAVFEQRMKLLSMLRNSLYDQFRSLVSSLLGDYTHLYRHIKGTTKYADFQVEWLQHIRAVAENGYTFANCDAQPAYQYELDPIPTSDTNAIWAIMYCQAMEVLGEISSDTNLIMLHTIANSVYNYQLQQVIDTQRHETTVTTSQPSCDDALYRMCGAEICRMLKSRQKGNTESTTCEISCLKRMTITAKDKERAMLPQGIKNLDQTGYMWVPIPELLPYLREVDRIFRSEVNHDKFRQRGDQIFKVLMQQPLYSRLSLIMYFC